MNKHKILNGGQWRTLLGGPKERKERKACQEENNGFHKGAFRPYQQARIFPNTKAEERIKKEKQGRNLSSIRIVSLRNTQ